MLLETSVKYFDSTMAVMPSLTAEPTSAISLLKACLSDGVFLGSVTDIVSKNNEITFTCDFPVNSLKKYTVIKISNADVDINGEYKVKEIIPPFTIKCDTVINRNINVSGSYRIELPPAGWNYVDLSNNLTFFKSRSKTASNAGLLVDDNHPLFLKVSGCEGFDNYHTPINVFNHNGHFIQKAINATTPNNWFVIANSKFAFIGFYNSNNLKGYRVLSVGDFISKKPGDRYNFMLSGGGVSDLNGNEFRSQNGATRCIEASIFAIRPSFTQFSPVVCRGLTEEPVPVKIATQAYAPSLQNWNMLGFTAKLSGLSPDLVYPNDATGGLCLSKIYFIEEITKTFRGIVPGCFYSPLNIDLQINVDPKRLTNYDTKTETESGVVTSVVCIGDFYGTIGVGFIDPVGPWNN